MFFSKIIPLRVSPPVYNYLMDEPRHTGDRMEHKVLTGHDMKTAKWHQAQQKHLQEREREAELSAGEDYLTTLRRRISEGKSIDGA